MFRTLGLAACAAGLTTAAALAAPVPGDGDPCAPAARLEGEPRLVAPLQALLAGRGISSKPTAGCAALLVQVRRARPGFDLLIADADGRRARRHLARAESAAMLIESWARTDLESSLSVIHTALEIPAPAAVAPATAAGPDPPASPLDGWRSTISAGGPASELAAVGGPVSSPAGRSPAGTRLQLSTAFESSVDRSRSLWLGAGAGLCVRLSAFCTGAAARFAAAPDARRSDLAATVERPWVLGRFLLSPSLGLGVSFARLAAQAPADDGPPGDSGPRNARRNERARDPHPKRDGRGGDRSMLDLDREAAAPATPTGERWVAEALRAHAGVALLGPLTSWLSVEVALIYWMPVRSWAPDGGSGSSRSQDELGLRLGVRYGPR